MLQYKCVHFALLLTIFSLRAAPLQRTILGVRLRPEAAAIVDNVERAFGMAIDIQRHNSDPKNLSARGFVSAQGVPTLEFPQNFTVSEELIVHEVFHLNQRVEGFADGIPVFQSEDMASPHAVAFQAAYNALLPILGLYFTDVIEHSVFYPKIQKMDIDPFTTFRNTVRTVVAAQKDSSSAVPVDIETAAKQGRVVESLALWYFKVSMDTDDPALLDAITKAPAQTPESLRIGRGLQRILSSHHPQTPKAAADTTVTALNCLFGKIASFSLTGLHDDKTTGKIAVKRLVVKVNSPMLSDGCYEQQ